MSDRLAAALEELAEALRDEVRAELEDAVEAPDRLYSVDEACQLLGIRRGLMYDLIRLERIRSVKVGGRRLVPASAIAEFIASGRS